MSTSAAQSSSAISDPGMAKVDMKFELIVIAVSDVRPCEEVLPVPRIEARHRFHGLRLITKTTGV